MEPRIRLLRSQWEVRCDHCGATALSVCRMPNGTAMLPHDERLRKVVNYPKLATRLLVTGQLRTKLWEQVQHLARNESQRI